MNSVLFPFWLWLLIVLIIILIVLWLLFRPESKDQKDFSSRSGEESSFSSATPAAVPSAEMAKPDFESAPDPEPHTAGILHVQDEDDEDEPIEEGSEPVAEIADEAADESIEDKVVSDETGAEDNLRIIEGIGPKIESVLKRAGVRTLRQLSEMSAESIQAILTENNLRLANPETWPEQARLAADGDMEALEALQDKLKGGRVV